MSDTVILNVAGTRFYAFKSTLIKSEYFNKMFAFENNPAIPIFIDCDPEGFKHILKYLRFKYLAPYFIIDDSAFVSDDNIIPEHINRDITIGGAMVRLGESALAQSNLPVRDLRSPSMHRWTFSEPRSEYRLGDTLTEDKVAIEKLISSNVHALTKSNKIFGIMYHLAMTDAKNLFQNPDFVIKTLILQHEMKVNSYPSILRSSRDEYRTGESVCIPQIDSQYQKM